MSSLKEFQCEICGIVSENPIHWFVIECGDQKLAVIKWDLTAAMSMSAHHFCGEAHAQVYISRWFESVCVPTRRLKGARATHSNQKPIIKNQFSESPLPHRPAILR